jgi:hypothetical protein
MKGKTMKQTIIISIIMLAGNFVFGQSIVTTNKQWNNFINYYNGGWPPVDGYEYIKFTTDTVINSLTYKNVKRINENQMYWLPYGFIRENDSNQVFYKINAVDPERLLYDMNVQSHQTILVYGLGTSFNYENLDSMRFYIRNIDSILIDQSYHRRINLALPEDTAHVLEQWIDSIGSMGGMLHNQYYYVGGDKFTLQCFFENGILTYHDPNYANCVYFTGTDEKTDFAPTFSVFPNPISDIAILAINGAEEKKSISVCFFNLLGKMVYQSSGADRITLSKNNFKPGIYFFTITFSKVVIGSGKIIIE